MSIAGDRRLVRRRAVSAAVLATAALASGCGSKPDYPPNLSFPSRADRLVLKTPETTPAALYDPQKLPEELARLDSLGGKTVEPSSLPAASRTALDRYLRDAFGTPAAPTVNGPPEANAAAERLSLKADALAEGSKLFRKNCLQCHNLTGDGRGTAGNVVPPPRDFRRGVFKFTSAGMAKPRRADLLRTLHTGLPTTAMPAFSLLPEEDRDLLARFVNYLSARGQVEFETLAALAGPEPPKDVAAFAAERVKAVIAEWEKAENAPPLPGISPQPDDGEPGSPNHAAAVRRAFKLFTAKADNSCITCHGDFGRKPVLRYDVWGTVAKPANLTERNAFKGGKRPEDVFARIRGGIAAVGMPAHPELTDRQVWDLVRLVQSLPYMRQLPEDVRAAVYPNP
jgi:mono/diheme cytochrome c family protein